MKVDPVSTVLEEKTDAARWRFFNHHAQSHWNGLPLVKWMGLDGVFKYGSRNAAIDAAMSAFATTEAGTKPLAGEHSGMNK